MRITIDDGLGIGWTLHAFKATGLSACFVVKGTYQFQNGGAPIAAEEPDELLGDKHTDDDICKSLVYPSDFAPFKPRADVLVLGTGHAPSKKPIARFPVRVKVGPVDKTLMVIGQRTWQRGLLSRSNVTEAQPVVTVPITYENAFGGPKSKKNPVGRGIESDELPTIEDPGRLITSPRDNIDPAGFAPIAAGWESRTKLVGSFDKRWLKERWPWFPANFDFGYFNGAPRDQQVEGYLNGDEELLFENLHAEYSLYRSRLPGHRARCFLFEESAHGDRAFREVPLRLDTVWLDLNVEKMILAWRGHVPVRSIKLKEVEQVLAWTEPLTEPPRPAAYCPVFLAEKRRAEAVALGEETPEEAAAAAAQEAQSAKELEQDFAQFDKDLAASEKEMVEMAAAADASWAAEKAALIASGINPALLEPNPNQSPSQAIRAALQDLKSSNTEQAADLQKELSEVEQVEAQGAAMEKEFEADFPPERTRDDVLAAIGRRESLAEWNLREMDLSGQDLSGLDLHGALLGEAVLQGANLQKANLTDADLSQANLSGVNLTHAILDGADLDGAILAGAKLTGVSLRGTTLSGLNLVGADLSGCTGKGADFSKTDLTGARFAGAQLPAADFSNAKLAGADFRNAAIPRADMDGVQAVGIILEETDLTGASASEGADLTKANCKRAQAAGAVFGGAALNKADFTRARLGRAQFSDGSLEGAVFDRADLTSASFDGAVLRKARLTNANLIRASFDQADLTEADLTGSNLYEAGFWQAVLDKTNLRNANVKGTTLG
jgi:uncharacterized protein YjbI with pentapeptide repeats